MFGYVDVLTLLELFIFIFIFIFLNLLLSSAVLINSGFLPD